MTEESLAARLLGLFVMELEDQLRSLNADLISLEGRPRDPALLGSAFRVLHTLKGAAHAAHVPEAEEVCHQLEALLSGAREGRYDLGPDDFALLFEAADALADAKERLKKGEPLAGSPLALLHLGMEGAAGDEGTIRRPTSEVPADVYVAAAMDPILATEGGAPQAGSDDGGDASGAIPLTPLAAPPAAPRAPATADGLEEEARSERVWVEAEQLDDLLARAGELMIVTGCIASRPAQVDQVLEVAGRSAAGLGMAMQRLRRLAKGGELPASMVEALEEVERTWTDYLQESGRLAQAFREDTRRLSQATTKVRQRVRSLRLRPFSDSCLALPRAVRDLAWELGKEARLEIRGGEVRADRAVISVLQEVLLHLVRNAVDHGIEPPGEREQSGKPRHGVVEVAAALDGHRLRVTVRDDGRGLDLDAVRAQLEDEGRPLPADPEEVAKALFDPGFSTRSTADHISGRGVGLDAVRAAMTRIRGNVSVSWTPGRGSVFTLEAPPSLATTRALLVSVGSQILAIPTASVARLLRVRPEEIQRAEGREVLITDAAPIPLLSLSTLLGPPLTEGPPAPVINVVSLEAGGRKMAIAVDAFVGEDEIVVRPVRHLRRPPYYFGGAALLSSGHVAIVLDVAPLIVAGLERNRTEAGVVGRSVELRRKRILVVDDSITTRSLEESILKAKGFDVLTASDGAEGWRLLQEGQIDLVVSDVEMPRMSGFELCEAIRASARLADTPVVLVTGLETPEHRARGLEAGADAYVSKSSFDQTALLETIEQLLG